MADYRGNEYVAIVYGRGPLFLEAMAGNIGKQAFDTCLRQYYQSNKWQIVTTASFQSHFETCSTSDLDELFRTWVQS
ncbi:MAG: M1 family aminopeptidase [Dehalococcoidia bacterium]|nr:M1 family aminopeptidase [Dehalococcoidia bacterium]